MNEYIKKSEAIKAIRENPSKMAVYTSKAICAIEKLPTADVAQKIEWSREIFEEIDKRLIDAIKVWREERAYHVHNKNQLDMIDSRIDAYRCFRDVVEKLKKKYTEETE